MGALVVDKDEDDAEDQPCEAGGGTSTVDTTKVLKDRSASKAEPERCPLMSENQQMSRRK